MNEDLTLTAVIDFGMWQGGSSAHDFAVLTMYHPDVELAWLEPPYRDTPFDESFHRRVRRERINTAMGTFAHDLREGSAEYAESALAGLRGMLMVWPKNG